MKTCDHPPIHLVVDLPESGRCLLGEFKVLYTRQHLEWLADRLRQVGSPITVDLETWSTREDEIGSDSHYDNADIALTAISAGKALRAVIVHTESDVPVREWFNVILDSGKPIVAYNADYDLRFIKRETGRLPEQVIDPMVLFGLLMAGRSQAPKGKQSSDKEIHGISLSDAFERYTGLPLPKTVRSGFYGSDSGLVISERELEYAALDTIATEYVLQEMLREIAENDMWTIAALETALVPVVLRINMHGIPIDRSLLEEYERQMREMARQHTDRLLELMAQDVFTVVAPGTDVTPLTPEEDAALRTFSRTTRHLLSPRAGMKMSQLITLYRTDPDTPVVLYKDIFAANLGKSVDTVTTTPAKYLKMDSSGFWGSYLSALSAYSVRNSSADQLGVFVNSCAIDRLESYRTFRQMKLAREVAEELLRYRRVSKILGGFIEPWMERTVHEPIIYTRFQQTRTDTGRFSSNNPNMQNVPRPINDIGINMRDVVCAPDGYLLVTADYSQYELRVAAQLAREERMIRLYREEGAIRERIAQILQDRYGLLPFEWPDEPDEELLELKSKLADLDLHRYNASLIFHKPQSEITKEERTQAKVVSFGVLYGMQAESLSQRLLSDLGTPIDIDEAKRLLERYFSSFPALRDYIQSTAEFAITHGYVSTPLGRKRWVVLPDRRVMNHYPLQDKSYTTEVERIRREMVNATIQSVNADATKLAILLLHQRLASDPDIDLESEYIVLTVHDEIVVQVREENARKVARYVWESMMEASKMAGLTDVPTVVELTISKNWSK